MEDDKRFVQSDNYGNDLAKKKAKFSPDDNIKLE